MLPFFVISQFLNGFGIYKFRRYRNIFYVTIFLNILAVILAGELSFFASLDQILFFAKQLYLFTVQLWK
ncbi:MAG TPA: hypothetical protein DCZ07_06100 [Alphaproteobacteria bacterium]|nr:hypothetical protein [Alphaproteobacteria bacterium]